jgi:Protein of unknown function (DUF2939)
MKKSTVLSIMAVVIFGLVGIYFGSPYLAARNLQNAAIEADADELEASVDFPAVRESLKSQLNVAMMTEMQNDPEMKDNPFAGLGAMLVPAMVDRMIDAYVTSDGLAAMVRGQKPNENSVPVTKEEIEFDSSYVNLDRFKVTMRNAALNEDGPSLVFDREGFASWKLVKIELPTEFLSKPAN